MCVCVKQKGYTITILASINTVRKHSLKQQCTANKEQEANQAIQGGKR